jgi:hypothetical protein
MSLEESKPEQVEAAIVAPRGLSCNLPSKDGYCTIPLMWLSNQDNPSSLWRTHDGNRLKVAQGYDGLVNATLRFGQVIRYDIQDGVAQGGKILDAAELTALWDDSWATNPPDAGKSGDLVIDNDGACQIYTDHSYCTLKAEWTTSGVQSASLWQRTPSGLRLVYEGAKEDAVQVGAYEQGTVYELREGSASTGELLSAGMTRGFRVESAGEITLPDGESCAISDPKGSCDLRVSWSSNDLSRVWMREQASSSIGLEGQSLVKVSAGGVIADLRAGGTATGKLLDRASLSAVLVDNAGSITPEGSGSCEIPYSGTDCEQTVSFKIEKGIGSLWNDKGNLIQTGDMGSAQISATEYGIAYHLRAGTDVTNPILDTYIAKGIRQTYRGSMQPTTVDNCTFNYQGGYCDISMTYEATDNASIWNMSEVKVAAGGAKSGAVNVRLNDLTGEATSTYNLDLKIHGGYSPRISDPVLASVVVQASQPSHTGGLSTPSGTTCNLLYGRNDCMVTLSATTTASRASIWDQTTGSLVAYVNSGSGSYNISVPEGVRTYLLREGVQSSNKVLSSIELQAYRPTYFAQILFPNGNECQANVSNGACTLSIKLNSNTATRLRYRDVTTNPNATWSVAASGLSANASTAYSVANITTNRTYEFSIEQNSSPYMQLDVATATYTLIAPHTFSLTSVLPQPNSGIQCRGEWTEFHTSRCFNTTPISWNTTAPGITVCRFPTQSTNYDYCLYSTNGKTDFGSYWSTTGMTYRLDFYEGSVSPSTPAVAETSGYRLMHSENYVPAVMLKLEEENVGFLEKTASCELYDVDDNNCSVSYSIRNVRPYDAIHQNRNGSGFNKEYYITRNGVRVAGAWTNVGNPSISSSLAYDKTLGEENIFELRLVRGSTVNAASDPVVDTLTVGSFYRSVKGNVQARRINSSGVYSSGYYTDSTRYPYFFQRSIVSPGVYSSESEKCLLQHTDSTCDFYISAVIDNGSRGSIFLDGEYLASFTTNEAASDISALRKSLSVGAHVVSLYEGVGANSINNKKIDEFTVVVERPAYTGYITPTKTTAEINFPTDTVSVRVNYSANTRSYLYDTSTGKLLASLNPNYGADEKFRVTHYDNSVLGQGNHELELRTHQDANDPYNLVIARAPIMVNLLPQTISIRERPSYTQWYSECTLSERNQHCNIHFQYINARAESSTSSMSACNVLRDGSVSKRSALAAFDSYRDAAISILPNSDRIDFYYGPACPASSANNEGLTLLHSHPVVAKDPVVGVNIAVTKGSGTKDIQPSETEPMTWVCTQSYQGDSCSHAVKVTSVPQYMAGQPFNAYYGLFYGNAYPANTFYALSSANYQEYAVGYSITGNARYYRVQTCEDNNNSSANCPLDQNRQVTEFKVVTHLPDYTASVTAPNGAGCMVLYGSSTCSISLNVESTSSYVTLYIDGIAKQSFSTQAGSLLSGSATYALPGKAKGVPTLVEIRDGGSPGNRVLAALEIYPEILDSSIFKFNSPKDSSAYSLDYCWINALIPSENNESCEFNTSYSSNESVKYLKTSGGSAEAGQVSGNGVWNTTYSNALGNADKPYFAGDSHRSYLMAVDAFSDPEYKKPLDKINLAMKFVTYSGYDLVPGGHSYTNSGKSTRSYRNYYGYYLSMSGYSFSIDNEMQIDDIVLTRPSDCINYTGYISYMVPRYCGVIDYRQVTKIINKSDIGGFSINLPVANKVRRLYYRKSSGYADMNMVSDAVISNNGVARPLNLDGNWHYIDITDGAGMNVSVSAINAHTSNINLGLDVFAEYRVEN